MGKGRTIGIGMDYSTTSKLALRWAVDNLIHKPDDHIVIIHVLSPKSDPANKLLFEDTGSPAARATSGSCSVTDLALSSGGTCGIEAAVMGTCVRSVAERVLRAAKTVSAAHVFLPSF